MQFKDIVGQRDIINRLTAVIDSGRVSHAQMLLGEAALGMPLAWAYLQYLCCENRQHYGDGDLHADSCGECPSCKKIAALMHPDLHFVFPTATTSRVKEKPWSGEFQGEFRDFMLQTEGRGNIDDWYEALGIENKQGLIREMDADEVVKTLTLKAYEGGWRIMVVWMAEKMNESFANKLLKTLEEPLPGTLIMLVAESDERLLPTIKSRVQTIRLKVESGKLKDGGNAEFAEMLVGWLRMLFKLKMKELSAQVDKMASLNREQLKLFLQYAMKVMRDCFLNTAAGKECSLGSGDEKFDSQFPKMITVNNIELINTAFDDAIFAIERNAYAKIAMMELSFRMSKALKKR
ncbi:MAG: ATP-binding protein [bacterium]